MDDNVVEAMAMAPRAAPGGMSPLEGIEGCELPSLQPNMHSKS